MRFINRHSLLVFLALLSLGMFYAITTKARIVGERVDNVMAILQSEDLLAADIRRAYADMKLFLARGAAADVPESVFDDVERARAALAIGLDRHMLAASRKGLVDLSVVALRSDLRLMHQAIAQAIIEDFEHERFRLLLEDWRKRIDRHDAAIVANFYTEGADFSLRDRLGETVASFKTDFTYLILFGFLMIYTLIIYAQKTSLDRSLAAQRSLLAKLPVAVVVLDRDTDAVIYTNERMNAFTGKDALRRASLILRCDDALSGDKPDIVTLQCDDEVHSLNVSQIKTLWGSRPVRIYVLDDVTDLKRAEALKIEASRNETLALISGAIAHEVKSFVSVAKNNAEFVMIDAKQHDLDPRKVAARMSRIVKASTKFETLIRHIRHAFASPESVTFEPVNMFDIAVGAVISDRSSYESLRFDYELMEAEHVYVMASRHLMRAALENLVANAAEALTNAQVEQPTIGFRAVLERDRNFIALVIDDNAGGLPPERAADPFKFGSTTKSRGMGFGLYMAHNFVTKMGGEIVYEPLVDGSRFIVRLPVHYVGIPRTPELFDEGLLTVPIGHAA